MSAPWRARPPLPGAGTSSPSRPAGAELAAARAAVEAAVVGPGVAEAHRQAVLAFIDAHPDALVRSCAEGHLTTSAVVLDPTNRAVLVLLHAKLGKWLQPGGHADGDGDLAASALREATEETGIAGLVVVEPALDIDVHRVEPPREPPHDHLDVRFLVLAPPGAEPRGNHESRALRWAAATELAALGADSGLQRLAAAGLRVLDELGPADPLTRRQGPGRTSCG